LKEDLNITETELSFFRNELEKAKLELEGFKKTFFKQLKLKDDEIKHLRLQKVNFANEIVKSPIKSTEVCKKIVFPFLKNSL
jgi:hypothetical protein